MRNSGTQKHSSEVTFDTHDRFRTNNPHCFEKEIFDGIHCESANVKPSSKTSNKTQLFIGGMSNSTNLTALQDHLKAISNSKSAVYISVVLRLKRKTFSGYGIIKNIEHDSAEILLREAHFKFEGCWFGIKPFLKKKSDISSLRHNRAEKKIYLRGITESILESDLEKYFSRFGRVHHVQIGKHQITNVYKGFGFIEFNSITAIDAVLNQSTHRLKGAELICEKSKVHKHIVVPQDCNQRSKSPVMYIEKSEDCWDHSEHKSKPNIETMHRLINFNEYSEKINENHILSNIKFRVRLKYDL